MVRWLSLVLLCMVRLLATFSDAADTASALGCLAISVVGRTSRVSRLKPGEIICGGGAAVQSGRSVPTGNESYASISSTHEHACGCRAQLQFSGRSLEATPIVQNRGKQVTASSQMVQIMNRSRNPNLCRLCPKHTYILCGRSQRHLPRRASPATPCCRGPVS